MILLILVTNMRSEQAFFICHLWCSLFHFPPSCRGSFLRWQDVKAHQANSCQCPGHRTWANVCNLIMERHIVRDIPLYRLCSFITHYVVYCDISLVVGYQWLGILRQRHIGQVFIWRGGRFGARPTAMRQAMELWRGSLWMLSAPALLMSAEVNPHLQPARAVGALGHLGQGASGARKMAV